MVVDRYGERGCSCHDSQKAQRQEKDTNECVSFQGFSVAHFLHHFPIMSSYYESVHVQLSSPHPRKGLNVSP